MKDKFSKISKIARTGYMLNFVFFVATLILMTMSLYDFLIPQEAMGIIATAGIGAMIGSSVITIMRMK